MPEQASRVTEQKNTFTGALWSETIRANVLSVSVCVV